ncbi:hypothetical protein TEP_17115 [Stenotrophomonas sp. TEPEL]|nr:hypothetical protein TEP_17115 [Stenotrophomonas sp. TEPEL]
MCGGLTIFVLKIPGPLRGYELSKSSSTCAGHGPVCLSTLQLVAVRINVTAGEFKLESKSAPKYWVRDILPWSSRGCSDIARSVYEVAEAVGILPKARSSHTWLGRNGPLHSPVVFAESSLIPDQLADLQAFIEQNAGCRELFEAIAYQLFMIHPLQDGNGRVIRSMLIGLQSVGRDGFPLYLFWRLRFGKSRIFEQWRHAKECGAMQVCEREFTEWLSLAVRVEGLFGRIRSFGVCDRIIKAVCLYGSHSVEALRRVDGSIGNGLAEKLSRRWEACMSMGGSRWISEIEKDISSMMDAVK